MGGVDHTSKEFLKNCLRNLKFFNFAENEIEKTHSKVFYYLILQTSLCCHSSLTFYVKNWQKRKCRNIKDQWSISPTFYERICAHILAPKKVQISNVSTKNFAWNLYMKKPSVKYWWNWYQGSISPTFYEQLLRTSVAHAAFLYLHFRFVLYWCKPTNAKAVRRALVKLIPGGKPVSKFCLKFLYIAFHWRDHNSIVIQY